MSSPPSPRLSEEDQRRFENFSGMVGSLPLLVDDLSPAALAGNSARWANWLRLARRDRRLILRSEAGAMALGLAEALPNLSHEAIVELVRREIDLTDGEAVSILHLVSSVSGDEESAVADYNPDSEVEDEEAEEGSEEQEPGDDDDDGDHDDEEDEEEHAGDAPLREMSSSELNRRH